MSEGYSDNKHTRAGRLAVLALAGYALWVAYPMFWMLMSSLKPGAEVFRAPFSLPGADNLRVDNYARAWTEANFGDYFLNSAIVTCVSVALITGLGSMAAYALSRFRIPGGRLLFWLFLAGLTLPAQIAVIPLFFEMRALGLLNSLPGLILVYTANGLPFAIFVLAGFFRSIPKALHEAAIMDGCTEFQAFRKVMLPLAVPGIVTVAIFQFIGVWKEYFFAFMLLSGSGEDGVRTLPLGLGNLSVAAQYHTDYGMLFAGIVMVTLPILLVYLLLQKNLVKGITAGALKG